MAKINRPILLQSKERGFQISSLLSRLVNLKPATNPALRLLLNRGIFLPGRLPRFAIWEGGLGIRLLGLAADHKLIPSRRRFVVMFILKNRESFW